VADYDRLGDLRFALLVWHANLKLGLASACGTDATEPLLHEAAHTAADLISRCTSQAAKYWGVAQAPGTRENTNALGPGFQEGASHGR
jgi:hypothetical protein